MSIIERAMQRGAGEKPNDTAGAPDKDPGVLDKDAAQLHGDVAGTSPAHQPEVAAGDDTRSGLESDDSAARGSSSRPNALNLALMRRQGFLVPGDGRSVLAEEFRILKRPILANAFGESGHRVDRRNVVMVTSALPGEGKTYTAVNLALSIATELQRTVLLVDADVVKPSIAARTGLTVDRGLIDLLEHPGRDISDFLVRTNVPNLVVLGAGRSHGRSTELLASAAMAQLVDELSTRYPDRLVLFDSPPMLSTSESSVLARHMGQIVLTVQAGKTPRAAVSRVVKMLDVCDIVIPVLNKAAGIPGMNYAMGYYLDGKYGRQ
ncbi:XrtA-associated tyrosine autokinase [Immundisolibacter sp.]|uniref:XrtA-associated tyrosine autokinase n=1 Tax=Immundisolibacter sp. TaxID=1934948 RepID=UPI003569555B